MKKWTLVLIMGLFLLILPVGAQIKILHEFPNDTYDGKFPRGSLTSSVSTLFGMTMEGGGSDLGTIFKIGTNGSDYILLHKFSGGADDGAKPFGNVIVSGSTLYGMTNEGGDSNLGTIFKIGTDGSGFALLHEFAGYPSDGGWPYGSLIISGSTLYGMTDIGGSSGLGTIFEIQTDGSGFALLHEFAGYPSDGSRPYASLIISGSTLYGMTVNGGSKSNGYCGTIFKLETDGSGYSLLHEFSEGEEKGNTPYGSLIISGSTLYGMTAMGAEDNSYGTIFKIETDGSGFALLHKFTLSKNDGRTPLDSLIMLGSTLYGTTAQGGYNDIGAIFKIDTDGSNFSLLHSFGGSDDGGWPSGALIISDSTLYGTADAGGDNGWGVIFSLALPTLPLPSITVLSPNGGESWMEGSIQNVTWISTGFIASVNIDYSIDDGVNWIQVAANIANNEAVSQGSDRSGGSDPTRKTAATATAQSYAWTIPSTPSTLCRVRISDAANAAINDASDAVFSILMNLDLQAERREVKSFSIVKQYGQIQFMGGQQNAVVAEYRIMRRKGSDAFTVLRTVLPSELQNNQFQMQDKYLEKNIQYTYVVEAYNAAGQLVGRSAEKTI